MKVYLDASVIIAALLSPTGGSALLLKQSEKKLITTIASETILEEVFSKTTKIRKSEKEIQDFIVDNNIFIRKHITVDEIKQYEKIVAIEDAHVLSGAILAKCDYLVSLDKKHLLREDIQKKINNVKILTPKDLIQILIKIKKLSR